MNNSGFKNKFFLTCLIFCILFLLISYFMFSVFTNKSDEIALAEVSYTNNPVITVLTHGLGGNPRDWSNDGIHFNSADGGLTPFQKASADYYNTGYYKNYNFKYNSISLIEELQQKNPNSLVYIVSANNDSSLNSGNPYIDKVTPNPLSPTGYSSQAVSADDMDFTKHSIIVYKALDTWKDFVSYGGESYNNDYNIDYLQTDDDTVVGDFFRTIDYIVDLYQTANAGVLPKMNLIGHSQGTIVNLLYATKYPDRIDSMFALGGLFNGTSIVSSLYSVGQGTVSEKAEALQNTFGYTPNNPANSYGTGNATLSKLIGFITCPFVVDMANEDYTNALRTSWNSHVLNKPIKGYAVGSYFNMGFLKAQVNAQTSLNDAEKAIINLLISGVEKAYRLGINGRDLFANTIMNNISCLYGLTGLSPAQQGAITLALRTLFDSMVDDTVIPLDGFLEVSTQDADGYNNFQRFYRKYEYDTDFSHKSQEGLEIVHNLETQDTKTVNYICSNIDLGLPAIYTVQ